MLITTQNLPMSNGGIPLGTILLVAIIIGGAAFVTYQIMKEPTVIKKPNSEA